MQTYFDELQKQGKKAVLRFAYERDFMGRAAVGPTGEQILEHLDQLKPFLEQLAARAPYYISAYPTRDCPTAWGNTTRRLPIWRMK